MEGDSAGRSDPPPRAQRGDRGTVSESVLTELAARA